MCVYMVIGLMYDMSVVLLFPEFAQNILEYFGTSRSRHITVKPLI